MASVADVLQALEQVAPKRFALEYDRVGLQVGDPGAEIRRAVVSLDRSLAAVERASEIGAELLLAHHPLIFRPVDSVDVGTHVGRTILQLAQSGINFVAAHTNWDAAQGGVNDALAAKLGLQEVRAIGSAASVQNVKLVFFCPADSVDGVIDAVSDAGAGQIGLYSRCAFTHRGTGTFLGNEGSNPTVGVSGQVETVEEIRVEMVVRSDQRNSVESALVRSHPYEEPAYDFFQLLAKGEQPGGRIGKLKEPVSLAQFAREVDRALGTRCLAWGSRDREIRSVAVVGGAADGEWQAAQRAEADILVTGEVRQHNAVEAAESGFALVSAGHYATEQPGVVALADRMRESLPEIEWHVFEPEAGLAGRPLAQ